MIFREKGYGFADEINISEGTYATIPLNGDSEWIVFHVGDKIAWMDNTLTWDDLGRWASDMEAIYKYDIYDWSYHIYSGDNMEFMKRAVSEYKRKRKENPLSVMFALQNCGYEKVPDDFFDKL